MELGRAIEVKLLHPRNAPSPIWVTDSGMLMEVRLVQSSNTLSHISVIEVGKVTDCNSLHLAYLLLVDYQYYTL